MGLFLSMSGIVGVTKGAAEAALRAYAESRGGKFRPSATSAIEQDTLVLGEGGGNCSVLYPDEFFDWDEASAFLSSHLGAPVFSFHIHDGDLWMFDLFVGGKSVARFNPMPDYWDDDISDEEREAWAGDAEEVASFVSGLSADEIRPYFKYWDFEDEDPGKAFADDQFDFGDCWQMSDFQKRVGLSYPVDDAGKALGEAYQFSVPARKR